MKESAIDLLDPSRLLIWWYSVYVLAIPALAWLGAASAFWVFIFNLKPDSRLHKAYLFLGGLSLLPLGYYLLTWFFVREVAHQSLPRPMLATFNWVLSFGCGIAGAALWYRWLQPTLNVVLAKGKRTTDLERNTRTDVREIGKFLPKPIDFDPLDHINLEKGVFLGLDENRKEVFLNCGGSTSAPHIQVCGTTGAGKGVSLGLMASQFLELGEAVFFLDPKFDEWGPPLLFDAAKRTGKPYFFINLNRPNGSQFNLFEGVTEDEAFELFQAGFSLTEKGDASDFYGIEDRNEARKTAQLMVSKGLNIAQAYTQRQEEIAAEKFAGRLRELAETPSINALPGQGVNFERVVAEGGCVYIVGSMRNDIVKTIQRMIVMRLIQLAERRDRIAGSIRPICIVQDEIKYHLSRPAMEAWGAARDKGVHIIIANQSLCDLRDCTKDLNPDAVVDAVVENMKVKMAYRVMSPDTATWFSEMSGSIEVDDEQRKVMRNIAQAEIVAPERSIRQAERYYIDTNMLLNLPPSVCVLYGNGLPKFVTIKPLKVKKSYEAIAIALVPGAAAPTAADAIDVGKAEKADPLGGFDDLP